MTTMPVKIVHVAIERDWRHVYDYAHRPENMRHWAAGLAAGFTPDGEDWLADGGPLGTIRVRFAPGNTHGVVDHTVTLPDGQSVRNVLRVVPNGDGAEVIFMVLHLPGTTDDAFRADCEHVQKDLHMLKTILEQ